MRAAEYEWNMRAAVVASRDLHQRLQCLSSTACMGGPSVSRVDNMHVYTYHVLPLSACGVHARAPCACRTCAVTIVREVTGWMGDSMNGRELMDG